MEKKIFLNQKSRFKSKKKSDFFDFFFKIMIFSNPVGRTFRSGLSPKPGDFMG